MPVNSIKGALGHTMGAAAALEAIVCLLAGRYGQVPATLGLEERDPACDLDCVQGVAAGPAAAREPVHVARLRRLQRGPRDRERLMRAPAIRAVGLLVGLGSGRGGRCPPTPRGPPRDAPS